MRVVRIHGEPAVAWGRIDQRARERPNRVAVHGYLSLREPYERFREHWDSFQALALPVPSIDVDTTDGYEAAVDGIVEFLRRP